MRLPRVKGKKSLERLVNEIGILPFFSNEIDGFSLEECVDPRYYFPDEGEGIWEWKGPVIQETGCAYGKFFHGKAAFISADWYMDFANWRRDGYDFDALYEDGLARRADKIVYDILDEHGSLLSKELKRIGNYRKGGNKGFDGIITRLQMSGYVVISNFEYEQDKYGNTYGWGVARYETPESRFGDGFRQHVYDRTSEESYGRLFTHIKELTGTEDEKIKHFLKK